MVKTTYYTEESDPERYKRHQEAKKKSSTHQIIDNFLSNSDFKIIQEQVMSQEHSWYYGESVADESRYERDAYFVHLYYMDMPDTIKSKLDKEFKDRLPTKDENYDLIKPILNGIDYSFLLRVKANLYTRTERVVHHPDHQDYHFQHMAAIFYVNTNNGLTVLDNGTEVESVSNRLLLFNGASMHHSTSCTDKKRRVNINFNFM